MTALFHGHVQIQALAVRLLREAPHKDDWRLLQELLDDHFMVEELLDVAKELELADNESVIDRVREIVEERESFRQAGSHLDTNGPMDWGHVGVTDAITPAESWRSLEYVARLRFDLIERGFLAPDDVTTDIVALVGVLLP